MVDPAASQFQPVVCLKRCCGHSTQARNGTCYRKAIVRPSITGSAWCSCACEAKPENLIGDRAYDSDPLDEELRKGRHRNDRAAPVQPNQAAQSGSAAPEPLYATVARRAFLRLDTVAASHPRPLGVPRPELPRLCPARLPKRQRSLVALSLHFGQRMDLENQSGVQMSRRIVQVVAGLRNQYTAIKSRSAERAKRGVGRSFPTE